MRAPLGFPSYRRDIALKEVIGDEPAKFRSRVPRGRGPDGRGIVLRLRTGRRVSLRFSSFREPGVEIHSNADPEATSEAFRDMTGLDVQPAARLPRSALTVSLSVRCAAAAR